MGKYKELRIQKVSNETYEELKKRASEHKLSTNAFAKRIITGEAKAKIVRYGAKTGNDRIVITSIDGELKRDLTNVALQMGYYSLSEFLRPRLKEMYDNSEDRFKIPVPD